MHFIFNNPYRILGLTANASSREVAKRVADLETFAEFGKIKKYPLDLVEILPLTRTVDTIQQAAKDIENDTDKLVYAFFWFAKVDSVDELAIECIENNQVQKAFEISKLVKMKMMLNFHGDLIELLFHYFGAKVQILILTILNQR